MTYQDKEGPVALAEGEEQKKPPEINSEEDVPFPSGQQSVAIEDSEPMDENLNNTDDLQAQIIRFKYRTGRKVLYAAMAAMAALALIDLAASAQPPIESELINNAFEAFKLITMTVLGFIFGANDTTRTN